MRDVTLKDGARFALVAQHCHRLKDRVGKYLYSSETELGSFLKLIEQSEAIFQRNPQTIALDHILECLPEIEEGITDMLSSPSDKARKKVLLILALETTMTSSGDRGMEIIGSSYIKFFSSRKKGGSEAKQLIPKGEIGISYLSSAKDEQVFLSDLLYIYNDLMDIDPDNNKDLQKEQNNIIFFRDILMHMQEIQQQLSSILQSGFPFEVSSLAIKIDTDVKSKLKVYNKSLHTFEEEWETIIRKTWETQPYLTRFTVRQLMLLVIACFPKTRLSSTISEKDSFPIISLHYRCQDSLLDNWAMHVREMRNMSQEGSLVSKGGYVLEQLSGFFAKYDAAVSK